MRLPVPLLTLSSLSSLCLVGCSGSPHRDLQGHRLPRRRLLTVKLTVTAATDHRRVALVDPLPAGFEAVNPALADGKPPGPPSPTRDRWTPVTWNHPNLRDDRVEWFADHMAAGHDELTYQARATIDGHFTAAPATIEAMCQPDQHARTTREAITVAPSPFHP
jgi:uncharacterized protein YfaS (alpha-2-macroglobulin family)